MQIPLQRKSLYKSHHKEIRTPLFPKKIQKIRKKFQQISTIFKNSEKCSKKILFGPKYHKTTINCNENGTLH